MTATFTLPYYKQGDDLRFHLEQSADVGDALERHASDMDAAARKIRELRESLAGRDVQIEADTHMILIHADEDVIDLLAERELVEVWLDDEEE